MLVRATFATPVGGMLAVASDEALCALEFDDVGSRMSRLDARLARFFPGATVSDGSNGVLARVGGWLDAYFAGRDADIGGIPLGARGTPFEERVWKALVALPCGSTCSYGEVATSVTTRPNASRAVGLANGANPIAVIVPCHRVIGADGALTGYGGGLDRKLWLLSHEERHWPTPTSLSRVGRAASRQARLSF